MPRKRLVSTPLPANADRTERIGVPLLEADPNHADSFRARTIDRRGEARVTSLPAPLANISASALQAMRRFRTDRVIVRTDALAAYK